MKTIKIVLFFCIAYVTSITGLDSGWYGENQQILEDLAATIARIDCVPHVALRANDGGIVIYPDSPIYQNSQVIQGLRDIIVRDGSRDINLPAGISYNDLAAFVDYYEQRMPARADQISTFAKIHLTLRLPVR